MPLWACVLIAFLPPALIAVVAFQLSGRIDRANDNLMTSLVRIAGAALVVVCGFLLGTLWAQTSAYLEGWRGEYRAALELQRAVEILAPGEGEAVDAAVRDYLVAVRDTEIGMSGGSGSIWAGSTEATRALLATGEQLTALADGQSRTVVAELQASAERLLSARDRRLELGVPPGVPLVVLIAIALLAWAAVLALSLYPATPQRRVKALQTALVVLIIGLVQLPVYYLSGSGPVREYVTSLFVV